MSAAIPHDEPFILLGDFNARVGSRVSEYNLWSSVRGPHGYGVSNDAGEELLTFLAAHEATVVNTWFEKKSIYKQTWQHPKSKHWYYIDYAIMHQKDWSRCLNAKVKRSAGCNTNHQLLTVTIKLSVACHHSKAPSAAQMRMFDVSKLSLCERDGDFSKRMAFQQVVTCRQDFCSMA